MSNDKNIKVSSMKRFAAPMVFVGLFVATDVAIAQSTSEATPPVPAKAPSAAAVPDERPPPTVEQRAVIKKKAGAAYQLGRKLIQEKGACDVNGSVADTTAALDAFLDSLHHLPRPGTTFLAAVCHQALDHVEEALGMYEAYLRVPEVPEDLKHEAQKAVIALRARVGTIVIEDSQDGAKILVDGRARGEFPTPSPVIAVPGKRLVQVQLPGFTPFEATIGVLPGEVTKVSARMTSLPRLGRIEIKERNGKVVDVFVDGIFVGRTPWKGQLGEGDHGVVLRGDKDVGSQPVLATISGDKPTELLLAAERLDATIRIVPEPSGATVLIDNAFVGPGEFEGHLKPGEHSIKIVASGYVGANQTIKVGAGTDETMHITLVREEKAEQWQKPVTIVPVKAPATAAVSAPKWPWVVGGAGVVALGAAAAFGIGGINTTSELTDLCQGDLSNCAVPTEEQADAVALVNEQKNRDLGLAVGFTLIGIAGVTLGIVGLRSSPKTPAKTTSGFVMVPIAGPGIGGVAIAGRF